MKYNNEHSLHQLDWMYFNASRYANYSLPNEVDWRTAGAVTGVKDQVSTSQQLLLECSVCECVASIFNVLSMMFVQLPAHGGESM